MAIDGFDYKNFAATMAEQAKELVPADLQPQEKEYIVKTLGNFTLLAGEALYNDSSLNLTADQAIFITQIIAEWSFHKSIDLVHSGILPEFWDGIMQKIAFTIFEVAKQAIIRKIPQEQLLQAVEHHVVKVYKQSIDELQQKGIIDEQTKERAESQSNIDEMAKQAQVEQMKQQQEIAEQAQRNLEENERKREETEKSREVQKGAIPANQVIAGVSNKQMKLMSLAMLLKVLSQDKVTTILNKFDKKDSGAIAQYMDMANLESMVDSDLVADCLKQMKDLLPVKRKLTKENVILDLIDLYKVKSREEIEKVIRKERPFVKRFIARSYDGEYDEIPLRVAGIISAYIQESVQSK